MYRRFSSSFLLACIGVLTNQTAQAIDTHDLPDLSAEERGAVCQVIDHTMATVGTAFVIGRTQQGSYLALTNAHTTEGGRFELRFHSGVRAKRVTERSRCERRDLALLEFHSNCPIRPLEIAPYDYRATRKDPILAIGAADTRLCLHTGLYRETARRYSPGGDACYAACDAHIRPGFSGGPIAVVHRSTRKPVVIGCVARGNDQECVGPCHREIYSFLAEAEPTAGKLALGAAGRPLPAAVAKAEGRSSGLPSEFLPAPGGRVAEPSGVPAGRIVQTVEVHSRAGVHVTQTINGQTTTYFIPPANNK